jgi:acetoin:2,6-dichlorophenolindophenol oxidoreductase subunit alpha
VLHPETSHSALNVGALEPSTDQSLTGAQSTTDERERWLHAYEQMLKIRIFEEHVNELYTSAKMPGLAHLYSGEEAVAVGVCEALRRDDYITSTHRGHGHCLAKGASVDRMFAELLGKEAGYCRGKGGSIGQGLLYEVMNMASLWKLPVIYACEDNLYGEYTHFSEATAGEMSARARAFGIHAEEVDGQDVRAVYATMQRLVERARRGEGPAFIVCHTYRYHGHHVGDISRSYYRSKEEEQQWMTQRDPLKLLSTWLIEQHMADAQIFEQIERRVRAEVDAGVQFALNAPYPNPDEVDQHVYA